MTNPQLVTLSIDQNAIRAAEITSGGGPRASSYCIFVKLPKRKDRVLLVHGYTGAYDEVSLDVAAFLYSKRAVSAPLYGTWSSEFSNVSSELTLSPETLAELEHRGYLTTLTIGEEKERLRSIAGLLHSLERTALSYILVPNYDCNLRCPYCFQDHMRTDPSFRPLLRRMTGELFDRILSGIVDLESTRPEGISQSRQFTFFGGEPLMEANREIIDYIINRASALGPTTFGAVTNGTDLEVYRDLLGPEGISSLQITLDGPPRTHDQFRVYENGAGSFEKIARNIGLALDHGVELSIRVNVCRDNLPDLPALATEAKERGWTAYEKFRIYAAPIQQTSKFPNAGRLMNSRELGQSLRKLQEEYPITKHIETGDDTLKKRALALFRDPEIDPISDFKASFCGAHSGMYIFDPFGDIYACWEKMGDPQIRIGHVGSAGTFTFEMPMLSRWRNRTVASNPTCESCAYALQCGGGCAVLAEAQNGEYFSNHCDGYATRFKHAVAEAYEAFLIEEENGSEFSVPVAGGIPLEKRPGCL